MRGRGGPKSEVHSAERLMPLHPVTESVVAACVAVFIMIGSLVQPATANIFQIRDADGLHALFVNILDTVRDDLAVRSSLNSSNRFDEWRCLTKVDNELIAVSS